MFTQIDPAYRQAPVPASSALAPCTRPRALVSSDGVDGMQAVADRTAKAIQAIDGMRTRRSRPSWRCVFSWSMGMIWNCLTHPVRTLVIGLVLWISVVALECLRGDAGSCVRLISPALWLLAPFMFNPFGFVPRLFTGWGNSTSAGEPEGLQACCKEAIEMATARLSDGQKAEAARIAGEVVSEQVVGRLDAMETSHVSGLAMLSMLSFMACMGGGLVIARVFETVAERERAWEARHTAALARLDGVDARLTEHGGRLDGHDTQLGDHGRRLTAVEEAIATMTGQLSGLSLGGGAGGCSVTKPSHSNGRGV